MNKNLEHKITEKGFKYGFNYGIISPLGLKDVGNLITSYPTAIKEILQLKGPKRRERIGVLVGGTINASIGYGLPFFIFGAITGYTYHQISQ